MHAQALCCPICGQPHSGHSPSPDSTPAAADLREILAGIQRIETAMSQLATDEAAIAAKITTLQTNLSNLIASIPGQIQAALTAAGSDDATVDAALQALGPVLDSMNSAVTSATPAPATPAETDQSGAAQQQPDAASAA